LEKQVTDSERNNLFISAGKKGWVVVNPSSKPLYYCVLTVNGKIVFPYSLLEAGKRRMLPQASVPLFLRVKGRSNCSDMYIPD